mmetsp:Transcript_47300/g.96666  ORF Transcript_47300/g.96666 Transcript_47300/m.96666 type:complete len:249 (+) Transcript_47300:27-773(+)
MSTAAPTTNTDGAKRRNRSRGGAGRRRGPKTETNAEGEKERPESTPVPAGFKGQKKVGVVSAIIRKGRGKFGFIHICPGPEIDEAAPRIYFNMEDIPATEGTMRRGYIVSFTCSTDETDRFFASGLSLTAEGKVIAAEREAAIAVRNPERKEGGEPAEKKERARRERKPREDKFVDMKVTCEGKSETKTITFNFAQSIGKLKSVATTEFDCPVEYNVFANGVFLTKAILITMAAGDSLHLAPPKEETA